MDNIDASKVDFEDNVDANELLNRQSILAEEAIVEEVTNVGRDTFILISYRNYNNCRRCGRNMVRLLVTPNTRIISEDGRKLCAGDIFEGMIVNAVFSERMTRSMPPQSVAYSIEIVDSGNRVAVTQGTITEIDYRNRFMYVRSTGNPRQIIRFVVNSDTDILNSRCQEVDFRRLYSRLRVRVTHATFMTASIPPQTTAFSIQMF